MRPRYGLGLDTLRFLAGQDGRQKPNDVQPTSPHSNTYFVARRAASCRASLGVARHSALVSMSADRSWRVGGKAMVCSTSILSSVGMLRAFKGSRAVSQLVTIYLGA